MNTAQQIQVGDVVMPPERELRLWMRRHIQEKNLPESALHLNVEEIDQTSDKKGPWIIVRARYNETWGHTHKFTFRARPQTPWPIINRKEPETGIWDERTKTFIKPSGTVKQGRRPMFKPFREELCGSKGGKAKRGWADSQHIRETFEREQPETAAAAKPAHTPGRGWLPGMSREQLKTELELEKLQRESNWQAYQEALRLLNQAETQRDALLAALKQSRAAVKRALEHLGCDPCHLVEALEADDAAIAEAEPKD